MPWKECSVTDERMQFVARRLAGEAMAELCREFGISRKTGYKISIAIRNVACRGSRTEAGAKGCSEALQRAKIHSETGFYSEQESQTHG